MPETPPSVHGLWLPGGLPAAITPPEAFISANADDVVLPWTPLGPPPMTPPEAFQWWLGGA